MKITFIQTGGTIDKDYPQRETDHGYEFKIAEPAFNFILKKVKPDFEYEVISILKKDSLDIMEEDREKIYSVVNSLENDKIVITHGTDTIQKTAEKLSYIQNKTIILTGAMLPEKFCNSDADFNIGMATGVVQTLDKGVYIALYGEVCSWDKFKLK